MGARKSGLHRRGVGRVRFEGSERLSNARFADLLRAPPGFYPRRFNTAIFLTLKNRYSQNTVKAKTIGRTLLPRERKIAVAIWKIQG